jgi:hypothetical protein
MHADEPISLTITGCLQEIDARLKRAVVIARAAVMCAEVGQEAEALQIALDLEQLTGEADHLLGMAALMGRMRRQRERGGSG